MESPVGIEKEGSVVKYWAETPERFSLVLKRLEDTKVYAYAHFLFISVQSLILFTFI